MKNKVSVFFDLTNKYMERQPIASLILLISIISLFLYFRFIFGSSIYAYHDVGADTYYAYIPFIGFASDLIRDFKLYSFNIGLGDNIFKISQLFDIFHFLY